MANIFQKALNHIFKKFADNPANMLVFTGCLGWLFSSLAQISALLVNDKLSNKEKMFLIPQEIGDALINMFSFVLVTKSVEKFTSKMFKIGKFAPNSVRKYLNDNKETIKNVGKLDCNLDEILAKASDKQILSKYKLCKNFYTTLATVGASVVSSNIVTPLLRNKTASYTQNIMKQSIQEPEKENENVTIVKPFLNTQIPKSSNLRI